MTDLLNQPPLLRLSLEDCKIAYEAYRNKTSEYFYLPSFEERYESRLEGILGSLSQSFENEYLFPTLGQAAAGYFVKISTQHPFRDGNKRLAVFFTDVFLILNNIDLKVPFKEMYELAKFIVLKKEQGYSPELLQEFCLMIFNKSLEK